MVQTSEKDVRVREVTTTALLHYYSWPVSNPPLLLSTENSLERCPPVLLASIKPPSSFFHRKYLREVAMVASSAGGQFSCPSGQGKGPKRAINTNTVETRFLYKYQYNTTKRTAIQVKSEIEIHCKYNGKIVEIQYKGRGESWRWGAGESVQQQGATTHQRDPPPCLHIWCPVPILPYFSFDTVVKICSYLALLTYLVLPYSKFDSAVKGCVKS